MKRDVYTERPLKSDTKHLDMISVSSNDQTRDNSEIKREQFQEMREYVTQQFDLNQVGNKNKHNFRKGNIKKKLMSSRFNFSDKRNISSSLRVKDEIKATLRRENQGLEYKLEPRILGRGRVFNNKNGISLGHTVQSTSRKDFKKIRKSMIVKSNSRGNLAEGIPLRIPPLLIVIIKSC
jgi:hypothetical protein